MCIHVYVCYGRVCDVGKQQRESERNSVESENHPISLLPSRLYWVVEGCGGCSGGGGGAVGSTRPFSGASDKPAIEITLPQFARHYSVFICPIVLPMCKHVCVCLCVRLCAASSSLINSASPLFSRFLATS